MRGCLEACGTAGGAGAAHQKLVRSRGCSAAATAGGEVAGMRGDMHAHIDVPARTLHDLVLGGGGMG